MNLRNKSFKAIEEITALEKQICDLKKFVEEPAVRADASSNEDKRHSSGMRSQTVRFTPRDTWHVIDDDDFIYDATLTIVGDFPNAESRQVYVQWLCKRLNGVPEGWQLMPSIGQLVKSDDPKETRVFEVSEIHASGAAGFWVRGKGTAWFNTKFISPASKEDALRYVHDLGRKIDET